MPGGGLQHVEIVFTAPAVHHQAAPGLHQGCDTIGQAFRNAVGIVAGLAGVCQFVSTAQDGDSWLAMNFHTR